MMAAGPEFPLTDLSLRFEGFATHLRIHPKQGPTGESCLTNPSSAIDFL